LFGCAVLLFDFLLFPERNSASTFVVRHDGGTDHRHRPVPAVHVSRYPGLTELTAFQGTLTVDGFALFFNAIFMWGADRGLDVLSLPGDRSEHHGEYYGLILLAQCGCISWRRART